MAVLLPQAGGVGSNINSPLAQLYLYEKIMDRYYERDFLAEITNSEIQERIKSCTQEVQFIKAVDVGDWSSYTPGMEMVHNEVTFTADKLSICYAAYLAFRFEETQLHYTCDWPKYEEKILESSYENFVKHQRSWVFSELISNVAEQNQGNNAGRYGEFNLGSIASPLHITPQNLPLMLGFIQATLSEHIHWVPGEMFLVVPIQFRNVLMLSDFANVAWTGGNGLTTDIDGMWNQPLNGFKIIETIHLPTAYLNGHQCFYMIAGHREAYAYAADIIGERITKGENTWAIKYQMLAAWGGKMLYPEFLAVVFGYFDAGLTF
jgi:hypothetical protein